MINDELGVPTFSETSTVENSDDALKNTQSWAYSLSRMISYIFYTGCLCHKLTSIYIINLWCWLVSTFRHSLHARSAPWFLFLFCTDWLGWASDWGWKYETTKWRTHIYWLLKAWSPLEILGWLTCHVLWFFFVVPHDWAIAIPEQTWRAGRPPTEIQLIRWCSHFWPM